MDYVEKIRRITGELNLSKFKKFLKTKVIQKNFLERWLWDSRALAAGQCRRRVGVAVALRRRRSVPIPSSPASASEIFPIPRQLRCYLSNSSDSCIGDMGSDDPLPCHVPDMGRCSLLHEEDDDDEIPHRDRGGGNSRIAGGLLADSCGFLDCWSSPGVRPRRSDDNEQSRYIYYLKLLLGILLTWPARELTRNSNNLWHSQRIQKMILKNI